MSILLHIKGIILTHLTAEPELKEAVLDIINCIDADLDACDFDEALVQDPTLDAIKQLDLVLIGEVEEEPEESNPVIKREELFTNDEESEES